MKLPRTYTQEYLPVDSNKVATIDKIKKWDYMDKIKAEVKIMITCQSLIM